MAAAPQAHIINDLTERVVAAGGTRPHRLQLLLASLVPPRTLVVVDDSSRIRFTFESRPKRQARKNFPGKQGLRTGPIALRRGRRIIYPVQVTVTPPTFSATEVVALTGLEERRVRKDVENGFFGSASPPRFDLSAVVYFRAVAELGFDIGVEDRKRLLGLIRNALKAPTPPSRLALSAIMELKLGDLVNEMTGKRERFEAWKGKLVEDENILGGEPAFAKSRLAVRQIGGMLIKGASAADVREDYPYLKDEDIEFAKLYTLAYPRVGRPREAPSR